MVDSIPFLTRRTGQLLFFLLAFLRISVAAGPLVAQPGGPEDIIITNQNTLNSTATPGTRLAVVQANTAASGQLNISIVNYLASSSVNAYVTGLDSNGLLVLLQADGTYYYPPATTASIPQPINVNVAIPLGPQGSTTNITLPSYLSAGRIWFADGTLQFFTVASGSGVGLVEPSAANPADPNAAINWGFVELTNIANGGLYANLSYVDFVGLPLGMSITGTSGLVQTAQGLPPTAVSDVCEDLAAQSAIDGQAWDNLCMADSSGDFLRILSPALYNSVDSTSFSTYWNTYIDDVWAYYSSNNLTIDTQTGSGLVNCTVTNVTLNCAGDNRGYAKPTAGDIFGCSSGTFAFQPGDNPIHYAIVPRLCAAFDRTTLLIPGGNVQPFLSAHYYYTTAPTSWYSYHVHQAELDGKGYAFSYDDVTPTDSINLSGLLAESSPALMQLFVGGQGAVASSSPGPSSASTTKASTTIMSSSLSKSSAAVSSSVLASSPTIASAVLSSATTIKQSLSVATSATVTSQAVVFSPTSTASEPTSASTTKSTRKTTTTKKKTTAKRKTTTKKTTTKKRILTTKKRASKKKTLSKKKTIKAAAVRKVKKLAKTAAKKAVEHLKLKAVKFGKATKTTKVKKTAAKPKSIKKHASETAKSKLERQRERVKKIERLLDGMLVE